MELCYAEEQPVKALGGSKDPKMAKIRAKNDSYQGLLKNNEKY